LTAFPYYMSFGTEMIIFRGKPIKKDFLTGSIRNFVIDVNKTNCYYTFKPYIMPYG